MIEHKDTNGGGKINVVTLLIDLLHQRRMCDHSAVGNFMQTLPKFVFQRYTGLASVYEN